jgi:hypothetical protein
MLIEEELDCHSDIEPSDLIAISKLIIPLEGQGRSSLINPSLGSKL